jgi:hypothetical protein
MSIHIDRLMLLKALNVVDEVKAKLPPVTEVSYIVYRDGNAYYAKNGETGQIEFSSRDASEAIQWAIDRASSEGGGKVVVKRGEYPVTKTITVKSGVVLEGEGWRFTRLFRYPPDTRFGPVLFITGEGVALRNIAVDGNFTSIPAKRDNLDVQNIVVGNARYVLIERILSTRPGGYTLTIGQDISNLNKNQNTPPFAPVYDAIIRDSIFFPGRETYGVGFDAMHIFGGGRIAVLNNIVYDTGDDWLGIGADANYPVQGVVVANNLVYTKYSRGVVLHTGTAGEVPAPGIIRDVFIIGNVVLGGGWLFATVPDSGDCTGFAENIYLIGNVGSDQVQIMTGRRIFLIGNVIYGVVVISNAHYNYPQDPSWGYGETSEIFFINNIMRWQIAIADRGSGKEIRDIYFEGNHIEFAGDAVVVGIGKNIVFKRNRFEGVPEHGCSIVLRGGTIHDVVVESNHFGVTQYTHILFEAGDIARVYIVNNYFSPNTTSNVEVRVGRDIYIYRNVISREARLSLSGYGPPSNVFFEENIVLPGATVVDRLGVAVVKRNRGYVTENTGVATIAAGSTRTTVSHGLAKAPTKVLVTPYANIRVWVENITGTSFDIVTDTAPATNVQVAWYAEV